MGPSFPDLRLQPGRKKLRQLAFLAMSPSGIFFHGRFRGGRKIELCRLGRLRENDAEVINSGTDRKNSKVARVMGDVSNAAQDYAAYIGQRGFLVIFLVIVFLNRDLEARDRFQVSKQKRQCAVYLFAE